MVELKTPLLRPFSEADCAQLAAAALADIDRAGLRRTCRFVSFDWRTLGAAKHLAPDIPAAHTTLAFAAVSPTSNLPSDVSETAKRLRESNLAGAPWYGSADWRGMTGGSYGEKLLRAMAADAKVSRHFLDRGEAARPWVITSGVARRPGLTLTLTLTRRGGEAARVQA